MAVCYYAMGSLIDLFDWPIALMISSGLTLSVAVGVDVFYANFPRAGWHEGHGTAGEL